ncbi:glycoside hydrolase family 140 protein [Cohnella sp. GCM10027633]|uniref:glycoside hydrolase family 140 protein n=1 Tax=unclassified Cohnella TaxID=2636738 RepID=UPI00363539AC
MSGGIQPLRVDAAGRLLTKEDGTPFFWLGDTAWELFHKLNREDAEQYLRVRAAQSFNVIQAVLLAEFEGATTGNAYGSKPLAIEADGRIDPANPDDDGEYSYWDHADYIIRLAGELGIYIALLPTWGDKFNRLWGKGPEIFTPDNAYAYGRWLGTRYRDQPNVVWVLGGDRPLHTRRHFDIVGRMAQGLKDGDNGKHLMTFHPSGGISSSLYVHDEPWLDFNMIQSSHDIGERTNYKLVESDYARLPVKPTLDAEPCYEDIPRGFQADNGYFDEADVRKAAYYAVFAGAFGHTYGHHSVWSMSDGAYASVAFEEPGAFFIMDWKTALRRPGAEQMRHLRSLMESRDTVGRMPDQELIAGNASGSNYMVATRGANYGWIYSPNGLAIRAATGKLAGTRLRASWFCPRTGAFIALGEFDRAEDRSFAPPTSGRGQDWVLCLDWTERNIDLNAYHRRD